MRWSILCSAWPSKGPSGIRVRRLPYASHGLYSQTCFVHLWGFCGFQVRKTQTTIETNTTAPSLLWSMTGGWSFTRAQEGRQKTTSPSGSSRCVGIIWILSHPSIYAYIQSLSSASCWHWYQKGISLFTTTLFQLLRPSAIHNFSMSNPAFLCPCSCVLSPRTAHLRGSQISAGTRRQTLALFRTSGWRKPSWLFLWICRMKPHLTTRRCQCRRLHHTWIVTLIGEYLCLMDQWSTCQVQGFWGPSPYCVHPV